MSETGSPLCMPLIETKASISSKKIMQGADCLALLKIFLTLASDSPTHLLSNSGPLIGIKLTPHSLASALAISVFPQPGGPKSKTPLMGSWWACFSNSGQRSGHRTASVSRRLTSSNPPISAQVSVGLMKVISLMEDGFISAKAALKCSIATSGFAGNKPSGSIPAKTRIPASLQRPSRSAPVKPCVTFANADKETSLVKGIFAL